MVCMEIDVNNTKFVQWYYTMIDRGFTPSTIAQIVYAGDINRYRR